MFDSDVMMRELEHRSANGMSTAIAALELTRAGKLSPGELDTAIGRLRGIATLDRTLAGSAGGEPVFLPVALSNLASQLEAAWPGITVEISPVSIAVRRDVLHRFSLIVAELVANSARHAYADAGGPVRVVVRDDGDRTILVVEDDGTPSGWTRPGGRGGAIVDGLASMLGGEVERVRHTTGGAAVTVDVVSISAPIDGLR